MLIDPNIASSGIETIAVLSGTGVINTTVTLEKAYSRIYAYGTAMGADGWIMMRPNGHSGTNDYLHRGWFNSNGTSLTIYNTTTSTGLLLILSKLSGDANHGSIYLNLQGQRAAGFANHSYVGTGGNRIAQRALIRYNQISTPVTSLQFVQTTATAGVYHIVVSGEAL